jgi:hypothetical protein
MLLAADLLTWTDPHPVHSPPPAPDTKPRTRTVVPGQGSKIAERRASALDAVPLAAVILGASGWAASGTTLFQCSWTCSGMDCPRC